MPRGAAGHPGGALLVDTRTAARPRLIVGCRQGYDSSSFAAGALRDLGRDATDVVGGVEGWPAAGLPLTDGPADVRK